MLIDTHCHLNSRDYKDFEGVLARAAENDVSLLVAIGSGEKFNGNEEALKLADKYPQIFSTVGIHPHDAKIVDDKILKKIEKMAEHKKVVAIGEIGLDFHPPPQGVSATARCRPSQCEEADASPKQKRRRAGVASDLHMGLHYDNFPRKVQEEVFVQFINLAKKLNKPIVIHDRDAGDRTYEILKEFCGQRPKVISRSSLVARRSKNKSPFDSAQDKRVTGLPVVIHCFTGTRELAKKYLDIGCFLSFTGVITFPKAKELHEVVKMVPIERMMVETDSPYLAPEPYRGKKNEPAYVKHVVEAIAKLKGLSFEDVARITTLNARRFFSLPLSDLTAKVAYVIRDSLYLNITNRCTLACTFCPKFIDFEVKGHYLKLPKEPTVDEVLSDIERYLSPFVPKGSLWDKGELSKSLDSHSEGGTTEESHEQPRQIDRSLVGSFAIAQDDKREIKLRKTSLRGEGEGGKYKEIVFCGYGEPTLRLDVLKEISSRLKKKYPKIKIRLNTDGLGNLIYGRNILPELAPLVDSISVSLNAPDAETYKKYCRSKFCENAYPAVKDFIREATRYIKEVTATAVGLPDVDISACKKVAEELGAKFRSREYNNVG